MIAFIPTRAGYDDLIAAAGRLPDACWVNRGVLTTEEILQARSHTQLNTFTDFVDIANASELAAALATLREHHPGESIWIEAAWV
jgi:hypothetical protein